MRWLHVLSGVMWIGLLWYLTVQIPSMPKIPDEHKPADWQGHRPPALFSLGALATVVTGVLLTWTLGYLMRASTLAVSRRMESAVAFALIMAFNVCPSFGRIKKKALGTSQVAPEEKTKAARLAMLTSRLNTMFSIPMLYMMVIQQNRGGSVF